MAPDPRRRGARTALPGLLTGLAVAGLLAFAVLGRPAPDPPVPMPSPMERNAAHCVAGAQTLVEVAETIAAEGPAGPDVVAELEQAEHDMVRRQEVPSRRLTATFGDVAAGLDRLRTAVATQQGVRPAIDGLLGLLDDLDLQCRAVLSGT